MRVEDIMTTDVATVRPYTPLKDVAHTLVDRAISGMPVVIDDGRVVGVISETDLLPHEPAPQRRHGLLAWLLERGDSAELRLPARVADDVMSRPAVTVEPFWSTAGAAALMLERGVKRLPVVRAGRLVGIITRADLVRAFARNDAEVQQDVRDLVAFQQALWSDAQPVEVAVAAGETTLRGQVERRSVAETLPMLIGKVAGVVNVRSELTWLEDDRYAAR
jgi:CBS domain-containing protein